MHQLSIFDMDKTITRAATFGPFLAYAVPRHRLWRLVFVPFVLLTSLGFALRLVSRGRLKEINLGLMMGRRIPADHLARIARGFAGFTLARNSLADALARIEQERAEGRRVVLATASYAFYVREIANLLGIKDVVATQTTRIDASISPELMAKTAMAGPSCAWLNAGWRIRTWPAAMPISAFFPIMCRMHPASTGRMRALPSTPMRRCAHWRRNGAGRSSTGAKAPSRPADQTINRSTAPSARSSRRSAVSPQGQAESPIAAFWAGRCDPSPRQWHWGLCPMAT